MPSKDFQQETTIGMDTLQACQLFCNERIYLEEILINSLPDEYFNDPSPVVRIPTTGDSDKRVPGKTIWKANNESCREWIAEGAGDT